MSRFLSLGPLSAFPPGGHTAKIEKHQLAVLRSENDEVHVVDNRCPHEGYPLAQGKLEDCILTCAWHNWKFDVRDGKAVMGGEGVRVFPCRIRDGNIEVDLSEPDPAALMATHLKSLREGLFKYENGRVFRDGLRLLQSGMTARDLLLEAIHYDAIHAEYGSSHVLPMAADACRQLECFAGLEAMNPVGHVLDLCGESNVRFPARKVPESITGGTREEFVRTTEAEDLVKSEGMLRGAILSGVKLSELDEWLYDACSDHFLDFGHPLIYVVKLQEFMRDMPEIKPDVLADVYGAIAYSIGTGTREDTLPYMRSYFKRFDAVSDELYQAYGQDRPDAPFDDKEFSRLTLEGSVAEASDALFAALRSGVSPERIATAFVHAASERLFRFDLEIEKSLTVAENWLWATHRFTFASAVRNAVLRFRQPKSLRFLVQTLAFTHTGRKMDAPIEQRLSTEPILATTEEIIAAIQKKDPETAVRGIAGYLENKASVAELRQAFYRHCPRDPFVRSIYVAHAVKVVVAAFEEYELHQDRAALFGMARFLASPVVCERRVERSIAQSIRWVADGQTPKKLTQ